MDNDDQPASEPDAATPTGTGACTKCPCSRFIADPTEPNTCINAGVYPNLCNHSKGSHR